MTARIEQGGAIRSLDFRQRQRVGEAVSGFLVLFEAACGGGLKLGQSTFGVQWRLAAFGRSEHDIHPRIHQHVIGGRKFFEPEPRLLTGLSQSVVRGQNHEDFVGHHACSLVTWFGGRLPACLPVALSRQEIAEHM